MKLEAKGVHTVKAKLAGGTERVYYYAWRGGPRIEAEPNTRAFMSAYVKLTRQRELSKAQEGSIAELIRKYQQSPKWRSLRQTTRDGYQYAIDKIEAEWGELRVRDVNNPGQRRCFLDWRDEIAEETPRMADLTISVLQSLLRYAIDRDYIPDHPLREIEKVSDGTRRDIIWTDKDIQTFKAAAPAHLVRALMLAMWTGQRQSDLLRLTWAAYDGTSLTVRQSKTNGLVRVKVADDLKALLDACKRPEVGPILTTEDGSPWRSGFRSSWRKALDNAKIEDRTFHDLRGTFVTLAYRNGASIKEIAEITGHTEKDAERIIRKHYLVSSAAVEAIESGTKQASAVKDG